MNTNWMKFSFFTILSSIHPSRISSSQSFLLVTCLRVGTPESHCFDLAAMASLPFSIPHTLTSPNNPKSQSSSTISKNVLLLQKLAALPRFNFSRHFFSDGSVTSKAPRIALCYALIPPDNHQFQLVEQSWRSQSLCKCCTRRTLLTSFGGAIISNVPAENISQAVEGFRSSVDMIREAVHPPRPGWCEEYFATVMNTTMRSYETEVAGYKRELFSRLNDNVKIVMELGVGTGPNLAYYGRRPSITNVIGVDPNEKMARYAEGAAVAAGLSPEQFQFVLAVGEGLPLPSASVDAVICTLVLCSVSDVSSTLKEIQRVLRPGGMFLFVEHVAAPEGDGLRFWQNLLDPVQQWVADGCHLQRDTLRFIEAADFATVNARRVTVAGSSLIGPHVIGSACVA